MQDVTRSPLDAPRPKAGAAAPVPSRPRVASRAVRQWSWRIVASAAVVIGAWHLGSSLVLGDVVRVVPVTRADFVMSVVASGHVEAPFRINVGSQISGVVKEVPVVEGQSVRAGDVLIRLDDREAHAGVVQAEGAVAQALARLRQQRELTLPAAEEQLSQARATLVNAQHVHDRAAKLALDGFGTRASLDEATKALDIARAQLRHAELVVFTNRPGGSDHVMVETQLNQARANLTIAQSRMSYTLITAPRDGVLIARDVEVGNVVQPTQVLMRLSPIGDTQLVVQIDEKNLSLIALGQKALASADAYPRERFAAELVYINPGIDLQRASVEVKLRVAEPPPYLRQDMTVSVDIEVASRPAALIAPAEDVRGLAGAAPWVLKVEGGRARRQTVTVGLVSAGRAEIVAGLRDGDLIVPQSAAAIVDGSRVRPRGGSLGRP